MDTNEIQEINKEAAIKDLDITTKEAEFLEKTDLPQTIAPLIFAAYRKGVEEYQMKFWNEETERKAYERKFTKLAVSVAELFIADKPTENDLPFDLPF